MDGWMDGRTDEWTDGRTLRTYQHNFSHVRAIGGR